MKSIQISYETSFLTCPSCQGGFLHQEEVEVWDRGEDEQVGLHVLVSDEEVRADKDQAGNPSNRRQAAAIYFSCETCDADSSLIISQHKGSTLVYWVDSVGLKKMRTDEIEERRLAMQKIRELVKAIAEENTDD
jgi:hypothetical protein